MPSGARPRCVRHHVDLIWLRTIGLSETMTHRKEFHEYVRGFDLRASFPHHSTMLRIAESIYDLQFEARVKKIQYLKSAFKGEACIGLQLDMWWDPDTQTAYAALMMTNTEEPPGNAPDAQLWLATEILDFDTFPYHAKTGESIKAWLLNVCVKNNLDHAMVTGLSPDGAADGQCGLNLIETLAAKVDTCMLHGEQRAILFALGLAGASSKNPESKAHLRKQHRVVQLVHQSGAVLKGIKQAQTAAGVPDRNIMVPAKTKVTRWGGQFNQIQKNNVLRQAIDQSVEKYKKENKNKEAIVEANESEQGSKVGVPVPASEIGLSSSDWNDSLEMEAFTSYAYDIKETIEHRACTVAQAMMLLHDLGTNFCDENASLSVKDFPATLRLEDRVRTVEVREAKDLTAMVVKARAVLKEELKSRFFTLRPSNWRLVQVATPRPCSC